MTYSTRTWIGLLVVLLPFLLIALPWSISRPFRSALRGWRVARRSGFELPLAEAMGMGLRGVDVARVVGAYGLLREAGFGMPLSKVETHYLAGGDVDAVAEAMFILHHAKRPANWNVVAAVDLAGRDVTAIARAGVDMEKVIGFKEFEGRFQKRGVGV